jgi:hypothetical protein
LVPYQKPQRLTALSHRAGSNSAVAPVVGLSCLTFTELGCVSYAIMHVALH